jgi:spore maturation protein CgeB
VRVLILDHYYGAFVDEVYTKDPNLGQRSFEEQYEQLSLGLFGETEFQVSALRSLGHEALFLPVNVAPLLESWARARAVRLRSRRGVRSLVSRVRHSDWMGDAIESIVDTYQPDLLHVQCVNVLRPLLIERLRAPGRIIVGQTATPLPSWFHPDVFDLMLTSLPNYVDRFKQAGVAARYLPLAFDPSLARELASPGRDIPVSFVGSLSPLHERRIELLSKVSREVPIDVWSLDQPSRKQSAWRLARFHQAAMGREMYRVLARSQVTVNVHGEVAEGYANCLRLYEATGMGALLITEAAPNLAGLFTPGTEVVTYRDEVDLKEVIRYYVAHPLDAAKIARAGQSRTLRDHTWRRRMAEMMAIIGSVGSART